MHLPRPRLQVAQVLLALCLLGGCVSGDRKLQACGPLPEYTAFNQTERFNRPESYIAFLRKARFTHGELDHLPESAIVFYGDPTRYFDQLGIAKQDVTMLELGTTDPSMIYIVHRANHAPFIINRGMPGAGGVATQTAEVIALGARNVIHIGTSGLLGPQINEGEVVLASAAYRDSGAYLLASDTGPLAEPNAALNRQCEATLRSRQIPTQTATGYTIALYYFQPAGLINALLTSAQFSHPRPAFIEMEEASFFETAKRMNAKAVSLTVGADRYLIEDGKLRHEFLNDTKVRAALGQALMVATDVFDSQAK